MAGTRVASVAFCPCEKFALTLLFAIILAFLETADFWILVDVIQRVSSIYFETAVCNEKGISDALKILNIETLEYLLISEFHAINLH